jgi:hypothetical protein
MPSTQYPCLSLAIDQLLAADPNHYAIWVLKSPYPGGHVHHDLLWSDEISQSWQAWQGMFSARMIASIPQVFPVYQPDLATPDDQVDLAVQEQGSLIVGYSGRLMQHFGIQLWQWLFSGAIQSSYDQSLGIAIGQDKPLRIRLDVRVPDLIELPWEIMQAQPGKPPVSSHPSLLFSRTTSDVDPLSRIKPHKTLGVLLVLGSNEPEALALTAGGKSSRVSSELDLKREAEALTHLFRSCCSDLSPAKGYISVPQAGYRVDALLQPSPAELMERLETGQYNVLFYSGHGVPGPDGGQLFLTDDRTINGTELAQALLHSHVSLAVLNACWGAQPDRVGGQLVPRSSLAEVLIHHGVPAVLAMRDAIADQEALSFIRAFTQALVDHVPIDHATAIARQRLLAEYQFNQPAWTLPVLYMHPEFDGVLLEALTPNSTEPTITTEIGILAPEAYLRPISPPYQTWWIKDGFASIGRQRKNDVVLPEKWVSQYHAEIFCREAITGSVAPTFFLRDFSRYGTLVKSGEDWQLVNHQVVPLGPKTQIKFGSPQGQVLEFSLADTGSP